MDLTFSLNLQTMRYVSLFQSNIRDNTQVNKHYTNNQIFLSFHCFNVLVVIQPIKRFLKVNNRRGLAIGIHKIKIHFYLHFALIRNTFQHKTTLTIFCFFRNCHITYLYFLTSSPTLIFLGSNAYFFWHQAVFLVGYNPSIPHRMPFFSIY